MAGRIAGGVGGDKTVTEVRVTGDRLQVAASNCLLSAAQDRPCGLRSCWLSPVPCNLSPAAPSESRTRQTDRPMRITSLPPQKHDPDRLSVFVDGEFRMGVAAEVALAANLRVGDEVDEARLLELERRDRTWQAREAALRLLAVRPRSAVELARRLRMKGYGAEVAEEVIGRLRELGLMDDAVFAGMLARDRVRLRPQGSRRLANELRQKGVDEETARTAIRETMEGEETDERELARRAAARWKPRPGEEPGRARRRLHGFLARRGFDGDVIREVMDETLSEDDQLE